jgi:hypothetical protein
MPAEALPAWIDQWRPERSWSNLASVRRDDLPLLFAGVEHRAWIKATEAYILGEREAPPSLDYRVSHFGHWLESEESTHLNEHPSFTAARDSFKAAYLLAAELCQLQAQGEKTQAKSKLQGLRIARDEFLNQVQLLLRSRQA